MEGKAAPLAKLFGFNAEDHMAEPIMADRLVDRNMSREKRMGFVRRVYTVLVAQLITTVLIALSFQRLSPKFMRDNTWILIVSVAVTFACLCCIGCIGATARRYPVNCILLGVITGSVGVMVGFLSAMYTWHSVLLCAGIAVIVFVVLTIYAMVTPYDYTGWMPYVMAALSVVASFGFTLWILRRCFGVNIPWLHMLYNVIGLLLFSFYIVFDTQRLMGEWGGHHLKFSVDDYVFATISLYIDIVNVFLHLLSLLGERKGMGGK